MTMLPFGQVAPTSRRAIAYVIDALIAGGLSAVLGGVLFAVAAASGSLQQMATTLLMGGPIVSIVLLAWFIVYTIMQAGNGSIGMRAQGLRLVRDRDGAPLGFGKALLRNIIFGLAASIVVGYFTPLFDGSGRFQGWHDRVAGALMIDARAARPAQSSADAAMPIPPVPPLPGNEVKPAPSLPPSAYAVPPAFPGSGPTQPSTPLPPRPPLPSADGFTDDTVIAPHAPAAQAAPESPPHPAASEGLIAFVPGVTQDSAPARPAAPHAPQAPAAAPAPLPTAAAPAPLPAAAPLPTAAPPAAPGSVPAAASAPAAPAAATVAESDADEIEDTRISVPGHRLVFTWDDGTRVSVSRRTVFGRNPNPEDGAVVVSVRDETLSLSKTHFEAAAENAGGWVKDRHSTNGITLVRNGQRIACPAGQRVPVQLGDALEIGDRIVTIGGYE